MCLGVFYVHFVYRSLPRSVRWLGRDSVLFSSFFFVLLLGLSRGSVSTLLCPSRFVPAPPFLLGLLRFSPHLAFFFWCCCDSLCSPLLISRHLFFRSAALHLSWINGLEGRCLRFGPAAGAPRRRWCLLVRRLPLSLFPLFLIYVLDLENHVACLCYAGAHRVVLVCWIGDIFVIETAFLWFRL